MKNSKTIVIGSDHAGLTLKNYLKENLTKQGYDIIDVGTFSSESCDYPIIAQKATEKILNNTCSEGILVCGTGIGISIAANKIAGIRAACCSDEFSTSCAKKHNNAHFLCLGERTITLDYALKLANIFLTTEFEGGRHQKRIDMITKIEKTKFKEI